VSDDKEDLELDRLAAELRLSPAATHNMGGTGVSDEERDPSALLAMLQDQGCCYCGWSSNHVF
jgi:hypothetical protein